MFHQDNARVHTLHTFAEKLSFANMGFYLFFIVAGLFMETHQNVCEIRNLNFVVCSNINQSTIYQISVFDHNGQMYYSSYTFHMERSNIKILPAKFLMTRYRIFKTNLEKLGIERIVPGAFDNQKDTLQYIYLNGNSLKKVNRDVFSTLVNLEYLNLQYNNIEEIDDSAFANLNTLHKLLLNNNRILKLSNNIFDHLNNLLDLDISHNNISILDHTLFISNANLTSLYVSYNNITNLPLDIFNSNLNLSSLDLSYNPVNHIDYSMFLKLSKLTMLNVSFTERTSVFHLEKTGIDNIAKLSLEGKNIKEINVSNKNLTSLSLSGNNLNDINSTLFQHCVNLLHLNLSSNQIAEIERTAFVDLTSLTTLDLSHNKIEVLPHGLFTNLLDLLYLDISSNLIRILPYGIFDTLQNLTSLSIASNEISSIMSYNLHSLKNLNQFYLDNNNIDNLDGAEISSQLASLKIISLDNNMWICSKLIRLIHSLEKRSINVVYGNTSHTHNINKIKCDDMIMMEDSTNNSFNYSGLREFFNKIVSSLDDKFYSSNFYSFFKKDFKDTEFYSYFKNLKNYTTQTVPNGIDAAHDNENKIIADKLIGNEQRKENNYAGLEVVLYLIFFLFFANILLTMYKFFYAKSFKRDMTYMEEVGLSHTELVEVNS